MSIINKEDVPYTSYLLNYRKSVADVIYPPITNFQNKLEFEQYTKEQLLQYISYFECLYYLNCRIAQICCSMSVDIGLKGNFSYHFHTCKLDGYVKIDKQLTEFSFHFPYKLIT